MNIQPLFPYPLAVSDLDTSLDVDFVKKLELTTNIKNLQSTDKDVLTHPELSVVKTFIESELDKYCTQVLCTTTAKLYVTQSWVNVTHPGQAHHQHIHPNSFISGVIYFQVADTNDMIRFSNPRTIYSLTIDPEQFNLFNSMTWSMPVQKNRLFLFPSLVPHEVPAVHGNTTRISLAFNTYVKGDIGNKDSNYFLKL